MFRVTSTWINQHKTKAGGFKKVQVIGIGIHWPLKQGWTVRAHGMWITDKQKEFFESFGGPAVPVTGPNDIESCLCDVLPWEDCEHTTSLFDHV